MLTTLPEILKIYLHQCYQLSHLTYKDATNKTDKYRKDCLLMFFWISEMKDYHYSDKCLHIDYHNSHWVLAIVALTFFPKYYKKVQWPKHYDNNNNQNEDTSLDTSVNKNNMCVYLQKIKRWNKLLKQFNQQNESNTE